MSRLSPPRICLALIAIGWLLTSTVLLLAAPAAAGKQNNRYIDRNNIRYLYLQNVARFYGISHNLNGKQMLLNSR